MKTIQKNNPLPHNQGMFRELAGFLLANKFWRLIPVAAVLGLLSLLAALAVVSGRAAPFIHTLF